MDIRCPVCGGQTEIVNQIIDNAREDGRQIFNIRRRCGKCLTRFNTRKMLTPETLRGKDIIISRENLERENRKFFDKNVRNYLTPVKNLLYPSIEFFLSYETASGRWFVVGKSPNHGSAFLIIGTADGDGGISLDLAISRAVQMSRRIAESWGIEPVEAGLAEPPPMRAS